MRVLEIFDSLQGEGVWTGTPMTFVRLAGCNAPALGLACVRWCDTPDSWDAVGGVELSVAEVAAQVRLPRVCLTGGEPLMQPVELAELIEVLHEQGRRVHLETNGTLPPALAAGGAEAPDCRKGATPDWVAVSPKPPHYGVAREWDGVDRRAEVRRRCGFRACVSPRTWGAGTRERSCACSPRRVRVPRECAAPSTWFSPTPSGVCRCSPTRCWACGSISLGPDLGRKPVSKVWFFITEALGSLRRNYFMTAAALVTVFLSMLVLGVVLVFASTINLVLRDVERKVEVTVFIKDDASADQTAALQKEILGWSEVKTATYVSKDQALERFKQDMKAHPEIWQSSGHQPAACVDRDLAQGPCTGDRGGADVWRAGEQIDEVRYGRETAERLLRRDVGHPQRRSWSSSSCWASSPCLLISNTIRLSIFARRRAVEIMKLVGATNWFIRWPFVIEGMTVGLVGAAGGACWWSVWAPTSCLGTLQGSLLFVTVPIQYRADPPADARPCSGSGVVIGAIGSAVGLRRFLDV